MDMHVPIHSNDRSGFTLIEIIIVLIILGLLVAIALPSLYSWIDRSHVTEATLTLKNLADQMDACQYAKDPTTCASQLMPATSNTPISINSSYYQYYGTGGDVQGDYIFYATWSNPGKNQNLNVICNTHSGTTIIGGIPSYGIIQLCYDGFTKARTITGSGIFNGVL